MKTSKIIFSIAVIAGVFVSTATMAQNRVVFTTRIVAAPHHYHPQPPVCGGYCAPAPHYNYYRPACRHQHVYNNSCNNNNYNNNHRNGNGHRHGNGYRNDNRNGNGRANPRHH